ncbi:hypothetical protein M8J76_014125 [Diaphorina citri]|nr:hypothetical protein M8J76_014125 [Diaphorina citri]
MHLCSQNVLEEFATKHESIKIGDQILGVKKLVDPGLVLNMINVVPHIPNELLASELKKSVRLLSDIKLTSYGMKDPRLRHILAYKRQVHIPSEDKDKVPIFITVTWKNVPFTIYLSFDSPRCYSCGKEGHISKNCPEPAQAPAQERLEVFKQSLAEETQETSMPSSLPPLPSDDDMMSGNEEEVPSTPEFINVTPSSSSAAAAASNDKNDFFPIFSSTRSSSLPSLTEEDTNVTLSPDPQFPPLKAPLNSQGTNKKFKRSHQNSESHAEKKPKFTPSSSDPELSDGFKSMVEKLVEEDEELSLSAVDVCNLLAKLKNSHKKKEIISQSELPMHEIKKILEKIHGCPDTSTNMKSRIQRLIQSVFSEPSMVLKNVDNVISH